MGLKPDEVWGLTLMEFDLMVTGYQERMDEHWDMTRHIMWATISYGGMGVKKPIKVNDVLPLHKDNRNAKRFIVNEFQALNLIKTFYE